MTVSEYPAMDGTSMSTHVSPVPGSGDIVEEGAEKNVTGVISVDMIKAQHT